MRKYQTDKKIRDWVIFTQFVWGSGEKSGAVSENHRQSLFSIHVKDPRLQGTKTPCAQYRVIRGLDMALTHPSDIPEEMAGLVRSWNRKSGRKNIRDIAEFHVHFESIHPFGDGNGRLGRILMVQQCLWSDYPPVIIENARKADYYDVLQYARKHALGPFVAFLVEEMEKTQKIVKKYL